LTEAPQFKSIISGVIKSVWIPMVPAWPVLKWALSMDVLTHLVRMIYHRDTPDLHAGQDFLGHFAVLAALTCFVSFYKPKGR
jgi:hypothetical protein